MGGSYLAGRQLPHKESYGGEQNWKETPGQNVPEMAVMVKRPVQNKQHFQYQRHNRDRRSGKKPQ